MFRRMWMLCMLMWLMWATDGLSEEPPPPAEGTVSVTRHYQGDIYTVKGEDKCNCSLGGGSVTVVPGEGCRCQCPPKMPTFRDDTLACVATLDECTLADFVSSTGSEKIPYVFMPLKHQLVHPTAEVALLGLEHGGTPLKSPVCVVTRGSILTKEGWKNMANTSTFEPPFRLFRDGGRTYVQWVGEEAARTAAEGRLVKVTLICRDAAKPNTPVFTPCLAFRVAGSLGVPGVAVSSPVKGGSTSGLSSSEGVIIGLVVTCLAITYVVAMTIYIKVKRRKRRVHSRSKLAEEGLRGSSKSRGGGGPSRRMSRPPSKPSLVSSEDDSDHEDIVDLSMASRARRANRERNSVTLTTAVIHGEGGREGGGRRSPGHEPSDGLERVPRSSLAVVETVGENVMEAREPRSVNIRNHEEGNGTPVDVHTAHAKKKLYFNPAYFEPEMLQSPPPAALEFLDRIREMISIAKSKMKMKMYQPSLIDIPEEDYENPSRSLSRSTGRCSQMTVPIDDLEDEMGDDAKYSSDQSIQSDSLERPKESDSRSSTLKKLARRVNSQGQSIVSEIIKTLDLKPRLPQNEGIYGWHMQKTQTPKAPPPKPVNARVESPVETDDEFPELIKPSMLRSVLRDGRRLTDLNNTFENFRQEMMATFNRMKKVGEAISPKSSLTRSKNKNKCDTSHNSTLVDKEKSGSSNSEGKVQKWLQTLEGKNAYTRMSDKKNIVFDSRTTLTQKEDVPPLPEKNSKPPMLPRKSKQLTQRSISFHEVKETSDGSSVSKDSIPSSQQLQGKNPISRSLSWQSEHRHYDSNPRRPRQQVPILPEDSLNTSYGSEDDSLSDLLSEAESKVPKMTPSDSESTYSDARSGHKDSLEHDKKGKPEVKSLSRQLPREEEMTARNEIFNKNTGAKTMSRLAKVSDASYEGTRVGNRSEDGMEDHTYEEILFPGEGRARPKRKAPSKPKGKSDIGEGRQSKGSRNAEDEGLCSIYSNPDSHVSEVTINEKCSSPVYSGCKVTIPVVDNIDTEEGAPLAGFDQDTLEKRGKKVQRSGSIIQDSLERPKVKKSDKPDANDNSSLERRKAQRRMSLPGEISKSKDKSLLDIYESRSSNRSIRNYRNISPERSYSPMKFSNTLSNRPSSNYLNNISNVNENNNIMNGNDTQKKLRTFRDYQEMKFQRNSSDSDISSSPLPVTGSSINLNFRSSSPNNKEQKEHKPPLPPKNTRGPDNEESPELPPKGRTIRPPLPQKSSRKMDMEIEANRPKLPEKSRKKNTSENLSRSSSGGSIPELTEEEARSILHGLLAHTMHDVNRLSPLHEEEDTRHFLGLGNTAVDSESQGSVPQLHSYHSGSLESSASSSSSMRSNQDSNSLGRTVETSLERQIVNGYGSLEDPGSPGSEARVSGEFILSTIGRSPSLRRQTSLSREQKNGFLAKLRDITDDATDGEAMSKGMEIALALKAKTELEKHFKEKSGADSIKRTWRRIIENTDDSKEDKDKISIMQLQQYMASLDRKEKETKLKQEDSGYQSTDSSESGISQALTTSSTNSTGSFTRLVLSKSFSSTSLDVKSQKPVFKRASSLQQLDSSVSFESTGEPALHRASFGASLGRHYSDSGSAGSSSIYVNNSFLEDDEGTHVKYQNSR